MAGSAPLVLARCNGRGSGSYGYRLHGVVRIGEIGEQLAVPPVGIEPTL